MRRYVSDKKLFVPGIKIDRAEISDLSADPVALGKITLKFSQSLGEYVKADINAQYRKIPEIRPFLEVHDALRTVTGARERSVYAARGRLENGDCENELTISLMAATIKE